MTVIKTKKLSLPLRLCIALYIISVLFGLMHWPFYLELTLVSVVGLLLFYSFRFYNKKEKNLIDHIKLFFVTAWCLNAVNKLLPLIKLPSFFSLVPYAILIWLILTKRISYSELFGELKLKKTEKILYTLVFTLTVATILLGVLFMIMHWPYASILLIIGLNIFSVILVLDYFVREYPLDQDEIEEIGKF